MKQRIMVITYFSLGLALGGADTRVGVMVAIASGAVSAVGYFTQWVWHLPAFSILLGVVVGLLML